MQLFWQPAWTVTVTKLPTNRGRLEVGKSGKPPSKGLFVQKKTKKQKPKTLKTFVELLRLRGFAGSSRQLCCGRVLRGRASCFVGGVTIPASFLPRGGNGRVVGLGARLCSAATVPTVECDKGVYSEHGVNVPGQVMTRRGLVAAGKPGPGRVANHPRLW